MVLRHIGKGRRLRRQGGEADYGAFLHSGIDWEATRYTMAVMMYRAAVAPEGKPGTAVAIGAQGVGLVEAGVGPLHPLRELAFERLDGGADVFLRHWPAVGHEGAVPVRVVRRRILRPLLGVQHPAEHG